MSEKSVVFGLHAVNSLVQQRPEDVQELWVLEGRVDAKLTDILNKARSAKISCQRKTKDQLSAAANGGVHQGVLAFAAAKRNYTEADLSELLGDSDARNLILVLDGVVDPHNLGACLRSADAFGVRCVIAPKDRAVGITPVVEKVSCGATETVPFIPVTNLVRTLKLLQESGYWVVGLDAEAEERIDEINLSENIVVVLGAEGDGMRRLTRENCDFLAKIPMMGQVESLNVSVATGVVLFECVRQRLK